ncbi:Hypothetical protein POVR1_LOCUS515 [uncultured virus]|nr:Hypothetical protein POVR1_LOCUS515 [uncultured virus]
MHLLILVLLFLTALADYKRIIVSVNYKPTQSSPFDVLDRNNSHWKSMGIDNLTQIAQHNVDKIFAFNDTYGLDFTQDIVYNPVFDALELYRNVTNSTGHIERVKIAMMFPYKLVYDTYRVELDTKYPERDFRRWYRNHFGTLILMYGNGTFTSGLAAGTKWSDQNIIGLNVWYLLKNGTDVTKPKNHERFTSFSMYPTLNSINSQGFREPVTKQDCADSRGRPCYDVTVSDTRVNYTTGQKFTVSTTTMIFPPPWMSTSDE